MRQLLVYEMMARQLQLHELRCPGENLGLGELHNKATNCFPGKPVAGGKLTNKVI